MSAEHRGFMSQKPEKQRRKGYYTIPPSCETVIAEFLKPGIHFHLFITEYGSVYLLEIRPLNSEDKK